MTSTAVLESSARLNHFNFIGNLFAILNAFEANEFHDREVAKMVSGHCFISVSEVDNFERSMGVFLGLGGSVDDLMHFACSPCSDGAGIGTQSFPRGAPPLPPPCDRFGTNLASARLLGDSKMAAQVLLRTFFLSGSFDGGDMHGVLLHVIVLAVFASITASSGHRTDRRTGRRCRSCSSRTNWRTRRRRQRFLRRTAFAHVHGLLRALCTA